MNIIASIRIFFLRGTKPAHSEHSLEKKDEQRNQPKGEDIENSIKSEPGLEFLDGMSTGTARFIIDREVSEDILENYDIKDLENKGRY